MLQSMELCLFFIILLSVTKLLLYLQQMTNGNLLIPFFGGISPSWLLFSFASFTSLHITHGANKKIVTYKNIVPSCLTEELGLFRQLNK